MGELREVSVGIAHIIAKCSRLNLFWGKADKTWIRKRGVFDARSFKAFAGFHVYRWRRQTQGFPDTMSLSCLKHPATFEDRTYLNNREIYMLRNNHGVNVEKLGSNGSEVK